MLKMKCSGGTPPCHRCRKANTHCVFEPPPPRAAEDPTHSEGRPFMVCASASTHPQPPEFSTQHDPGRDGCALQDSPSHHPSLADGSCTFHAAPSAPAPGPPGPVFILSPPSSSGIKRQKRRRISGGRDEDNCNGTDAESLTCEGDTDMSDASSPYHTVKAFEAAYRRLNSQDSMVSQMCTPYFDTQHGLSCKAMFPQSTTDRGPLLRCLYEIGISIDDAKDMLSLFGERVASFMPGLYDADFANMPNDPIYALAVIKVMTRYLPGVNALRSRVEPVLQTLLRNILFDDLRRPFDTALESMRGLAILYGYSEVGGARSQSDSGQSKADTLSIKGIIEGYAVRRNIGIPKPSNVLGCVLWLWLYTMSSQ